MVNNGATLSGMEPLATLLAGSSSGSKQASAQEVAGESKPPQGLVLGGGLPAIPADLMARVKKKLLRRTRRVPT